MSRFKEIIRKFFPYNFRNFIWKCIPKIHLVNTYILKEPQLVKKLHQISEKYNIRKTSIDEFNALYQFELKRDTKTARHKLMSRLKDEFWMPLSVINNENGEIAYTAWIVIKSIPYIEEFGINLSKEQFLLKDGFCNPDYRHQGLHTRMEQERINYCVKNGAKEIFIQIHDDNNNGIKSVSENGYKLFKQTKLIQWPVFNIYRPFKAFLKNPFRKIIK